MSAPASSSPADASDSRGSKRTLPGAAAADGRRVQPRHFHDGPNTAAASTSGHGAVAESEAEQRSPASRLYRHALESIFGWLNQRELATALQVSKSWLAAVESMASLQLTVGQPSVPLRVIAESAMGRHVAQLGLEHWRFPLPSDSLFIIARLMPQLRELHCTMNLKPTKWPLAFPSGLQTLALRITGAPTATVLNAAIRAISHLPLLESLTVVLPSIHDQFFFSSLASLPQLRHLAIHASDVDAEFSDAQVAELRALPLLRRLDVEPMSTSLLRRLLAPPHELQWQEITPPYPLDDEAAALLPQLPSLTKIDVCCSAAQFDWLQQLPNLTHVDVEVGKFHDASLMESAVAGLRRCNQIEHLSLKCPTVRIAQLADLLPRLPRLRTLDLSELDIDSLSFLALQPMAQQLSSLSIVWCNKLPVAELRHVHALRGLKSLEIIRSFNSPLDDHSLWLLTPPSLLLPQLEKFEYRQP